MATFAQLKARVARRLGSFNVTDNATELGEHLNDAVRDVLLETGVKVTTATVSLTAGTVDYTLDAAVLRIKSVTFDDNPDWVLEQVSPGEMDELRGRGAASTSGRLWYYALEGADLFMVYPAPSAAGTLNLRVVQKPTEMSSDAHDPSNVTYGGIPVEFHPALEEYALWKMADQDDDSTSDMGERYRQGYERWLTKIRRAVNVKGGTRRPRATLGRRHVPAAEPSRTLPWH